MQLTMSWLNAGGGQSDLNSLIRTLYPALYMIIFDEHVASLALPFIGSGKPRTVNVVAPVLIKQLSTFLRVPPHAPQSLKVLPKPRQ